MRKPYSHTGTHTQSISCSFSKPNPNTNTNSHSCSHADLNAHPDLFTDTLSEFDSDNNSNSDAKLVSDPDHYSNPRTYTHAEDSASKVHKAQRAGLKEAEEATGLTLQRKAG